MTKAKKKRKSVENAVTNCQSDSIKRISLILKYSLPTQSQHCVQRKHLSSDLEEVGNVLLVECLILSVLCATGGLTFDDLLWLCAKWRQGSAAVVVIITRCSEIMHAL